MVSLIFRHVVIVHAAVCQIETYQRNAYLLACIRE